VSPRQQDLTKLHRMRGAEINQLRGLKSELGRMTSRPGVVDLLRFKFVPPHAP
jgi:hypothetical protein